MLRDFRAPPDPWNLILDVVFRIFLLISILFRADTSRSSREYLMEFAIIGLIVSLMSLFLRDSCLPRNFELCSCRFRMCLGLALSANLVAVLGFHRLANASGTPTGDQRAILEVLSFLSAGAVAGFWGIEYGEARPDETQLLNVISALFVILFYGLFMAICFYIGRSTEMQKTPGASWVVPGIMALLLEINTVIDIWDYREPRKNGQTRSER